MTSILDRTLRRILPRTPVFQPARLGPDCRLPGPDRLVVTSGPLAGRTFGLAVSANPTTADFYLTQEPSCTPDPGTVDPSDPSSGVVAHTHFDRDAETGLETQWDIFVRPDHRGRGLSSLILRLSYRYLLAAGGRRWFHMRKLMQVDSRRRELQNIGIGIIALKIGMRPEPALEKILAPANVKSVQLIERTLAGPPGLFIELHRMPGVIVAAEFDPETGRPHTDIEHYRRLADSAELVAAARAGRALIGNIDYCLPREHINLFCLHFANTPAEHRVWLRSLNAGARHPR